MLLRIKEIADIIGGDVSKVQADDLKRFNRNSMRILRVKIFLIILIFQRFIKVILKECEISEETNVIA